MYPMPNGVQHLGEEESEGGSTDIEYVYNSEDDNEDCDESSDVESPPRSER